MVAPIGLMRYNGIGAEIAIIVTVLNNPFIGSDKLHNIVLCLSACTVVHVWMLTLLKVIKCYIHNRVTQCGNWEKAHLLGVYKMYVNSELGGLHKQTILLPNRCGFPKLGHVLCIMLL